MDPERLSQNVDSQSDSDSVDATGEGESLSRACTLDHELNTLGDPSATGMVHNWVLRSPVTNDIFLRGAFNALLDESAKLPAEQRLIMYDACDDQEIVQDLGVVRKRLDARRNTKPKPADQQRLLCSNCHRLILIYCHHQSISHAAAQLRLYLARLAGPAGFLTEAVHDGCW